jgi:hypothetical protein
LFTISSVSTKSCRRSECPTITNVHPTSASSGALTSPVNAPWASQWQSCAPSAIREPSSASCTAISAV